MSLIFEFSREDILASKIVTPDWYRVRIDTVGEKPSTSDNPETKTIYPVSGVILWNANNGNEEYAGVKTPPSWNFNDNPKAKGFVIGFVNALTGREVEPGERITLKAAEGKEIEVFIENDTYEGRTVNRINHKYRHASGDKPNSGQA